MPIWRRLRRVRRIVDMVDATERKGLGGADGLVWMLLVP